MTLDKVGAGDGPSLDGLRHALGRAPGKRVIAAGGVRNAADLDELAALGAYAVLVATAIHDGTLDRAALAARRRARLSVAGRPTAGYFGEKGCFTELRFSTTSFGVGVPATARWIDSLTA